MILRLTRNERSLLKGIAYGLSRDPFAPVITVNGTQYPRAYARAKERQLWDQAKAREL